MNGKEYKATFNQVDNTLDIWGIDVDVPDGEVVSIEGDPMILTSKVKRHKDQGAVYQVYEILEIRVYCETNIVLILKNLATIPVRWDGQRKMSHMFQDSVNMFMDLVKNS